MRILSISFFFFFNDTATTEIYTLSLHDALPICGRGPVAAEPAVPHPGQGQGARGDDGRRAAGGAGRRPADGDGRPVHGHGRLRGGRAARSGEHTPALPSPWYLGCRLLP